MENQTLPAIEKTFQCWNSTAKIPVDGFLHLSAHVTWIEGKTIVRAVAVEEPRIVEAPKLKCEVDLDDEWMTVIVHGPGEIPARATVIVKMKREVSVLVPRTEEPAVENLDGDMLL